MRWKQEGRFSAFATLFLAALSISAPFQSHQKAIIGEHAAAQTMHILLHKLAYGRP
jgi:hypothetical protein